MKNHTKIVGLALLFVTIVVRGSAQNIFPASGDVGIGLSNPAAGALQIAAPDKTVASAIAIRQSNTTAYGFDFALDQEVNGMGYIYAVQNNVKTALQQFDRNNKYVLFNGGNIGIGTATPGAKLEVDGNMKLTSGSGASITFADGTVQTTAYTGSSGSGTTQGITGSGATNTIPMFTGSSVVGNSNISQSGSNVGIGTTAPYGPLDVKGPTVDFIVSGRNLDPAVNYPLTFLQNSGSLLEGWNRSSGNGETDFIANRGLGGTGGFNFYDYTNAGALNPLVAIQGTGNVGIGTTVPGAKLEVDGNLKLTSGSGASLTFADGTVQSTAYTGVTFGGDYAESVDVTGSRTQYEPGDVLVLDTENAGRVLKSAEAYSTAVSGIYSTKPGVVGRRQTSDPKTAKTEVPMAMVGVVPTKVSAENGAIKVGDLLVTSSTSGYAMKGTDRGRMLGAVIGKAMGNLNAGMGVVEVLVTLQ